MGSGKGRADKYLRQFTVVECPQTMFKKKYPEFNHGLKLFTSAIPRNVRIPSVKEVVQNVCTIHSNVKKMIYGLNNLLGKLHKPELMIPVSSTEVVRCLICSNNPETSTSVQLDNVDTWPIDCCQGKCDHCGVEKFITQLKDKIRSALPGTSSLRVSFSSWQYVHEPGLDKKIKKLISQKILLNEFLDVWFTKSLTGFATHQRAMLQQWNVFKTPLHLPEDPNTIYIRTREDFQQDIQVLLREETVGSHRGQGKVSMVVYPIAVEVATSEGLNLHALSFTGLKTEKSYSSVHCYMVKTIQHMESLYNGRQCKLYQRMTDGCASQFWAYGSYASICELQKLVERVEFSRYAANEGKNLNDAIGGIIKKCVNSGILMRRPTYSPDGGCYLPSPEEISLVQLDEEEFDSYDVFHT